MTFAVGRCVNLRDFNVVNRGRACPHRLSESVTRSDRRRRKLRLERPSPPLARLCGLDGAIGPQVGTNRQSAGCPWGIPPKSAIELPTANVIEAFFITRQGIWNSVSEVPMPLPSLRQRAPVLRFTGLTRGGPRTEPN